MAHCLRKQPQARLNPLKTTPSGSAASGVGRGEIAHSQAIKYPCSIFLSFL